MGKKTFTNEIKQQMQDAYDAGDKKTFAAIYKGIMEPVKTSSYKDKSMYLEDLEWDLTDKKEFLEWILALSDRKRVINMIASNAE